MSMTLGEITSTSWHVYSTAVVECQEKKRLPGCRNASSGQWREATYRQRSLEVTWNHPPQAAHPTEGRTRRSQSRDTQTFTHFEGVDNGRSCSKWLQRLQASCDIKHLQCVSQEKRLLESVIKLSSISPSNLAINWCIRPVWCILPVLSPPWFGAYVQWNAFRHWGSLAHRPGTENTGGTGFLPVDGGCWCQDMPSKSAPRRE